MKYPFSGLLFAITFLLTLPAMATPLDDKWVALKNAIQAENLSKAKPGSPDGAIPAYLPSLLGNIDQTVSQIDLGNPVATTDTEAQIDQLFTAYSSDAVQKAGQALIDEIRQEHTDRINAFRDKVQTLLKLTADTVSQAKKADDLDSILVDLQKFQNPPSGGYTPENQGLYQQLSATLEYTKLWQNYLFDLAAGQTAQALGELQHLSQDNTGIGIVPRSQILERLSGLSAVAGGKDPAGTSPLPSSAGMILAGIKTLDEMEPALTLLEPRRQTDETFRKAYESLNGMVQLYSNLKAGLPMSVSISLNNNAGPSVNPDVQAQLIRAILVAYFDSYQGAAPAPNESPEVFVAHAITDAVKRNDWPLLQKAFTVHAYFILNSPFGSPSDNSPAGAEFLVAALNQEAASQYSMAVVSFQNALKSSDTSLPAKMIGEKLASIQKKHPREYQAGMQMLQGYPGLPTRSMSGYSDPAPGVVLSIPAAKSSVKKGAAASPSPAAK